VAAAPFTGAIYSDTTGTTVLKQLGQNCLYVGGGGNTSTAPNANPDGPDTIFGIASCPGNTLNLQGHAGSGAVAGNSNGWGGNPIGTDCSLGPYVTKHCTRTNAVCTTSNDCAAGSAGLCNPDPKCIFGPPLPVPAGGVSTCVLNVFRTDASGSVPDKTAGDANISLPLSSYVFLTGNGDSFCRNGADGVAGAGSAPIFGRCTSDANCTDLAGSAGACRNETSLLGATPANPFTACPVCDSFGTGVNHCISGINHGSPCTPVGSKKTTGDCLPRRNDFLSPLDVDLAPLGTGTSSLVAVNTGTSRAAQCIAANNPLPCCTGAGVGATCDGFFFCPVGTAASCTYSATGLSTCQRVRGAFGNQTAAHIKESGSPAGDLTDNLAHPVTISAVFCIPNTGSLLVDGGTGADLPGPGAVSIRGTFQLTP
jgi:hypothetical protein